MPAKYYEKHMEPIEHLHAIRNERFQIDPHTNQVDQKLAGLIGDCSRAHNRLSTGHASRGSTLFIYELLQNADDAEYANHTVPTVRIELDLKNGCLNWHANEKGFTAIDVESLCSIGDSSKAGNFEMTGKKGIGFKSVFNVSKKPHVFSNGYRFYFDYDFKPPQCPQLVKGLSAGQTVIEGGSSIYLPLKPGLTKKLQTHLKSLDHRVLLFLKKVRKIHLVVKAGNKWENIVEIGEAKGKFRVLSHIISENKKLGPKEESTLWIDEYQ
jgi:sacsin